MKNTPLPTVPERIAGDARSFRDLYRRTRQLQTDIQAWKVQPSASLELSEASAGLPPRPDQVPSAPLSTTSQAGFVPIAAALLTVGAFVAILTFVVVRLGGKSLAGGPLVRYGIILVGLQLMRSLISIRRPPQQS